MDTIDSDDIVEDAGGDMKKYPVVFLAIIHQHRNGIMTSLSKLNLVDC